MRSQMHEKAPSDCDDSSASFDREKESMFGVKNPIRTRIDTLYSASNEKRSECQERLEFDVSLRVVEVVSVEWPR